MSDPEPELLIKRHRQAPRYRAFIGTGAVLGLILALLATLWTGSGSDDYSFQSVLGYTAVSLALLGGLLGGLVAVILDRRS